MPESPFSLQRFAPEDVTFTLRKHGDHTFRIDSDPDVDVVARMFRIEEQLQTAESEPLVGEAALEARDLLLELIQEKDPEFAGPLKIGLSEITIVFSLILRGTSVAAAVADAILAPAVSGGSETGEKPFKHEAGDDAADEVGDDAPLRSEKPSPERLSGSATEEAGLPVTGTV